MKKKYTAQQQIIKLVVCAILLLSYNLSYAQCDVWTPKANFGGTARTNAVGFSIGTKGYIGTGYAFGGHTQDFWEYDPVTNVWSQKANFGGTGREGAVGFAIGTKGYIGTGYDGTGAAMQDFWEYNPATNVWTQKANFGGTARWLAVGFSVGTKGYIGTGNNNGTYTRDFWEYNPATNVWTQKANFGGTARRLGVGFSIGTKGYIGTGDDGSYTQDFWEYDPINNTWTQKANFGGTARFGAAGFVIGTKGYIGTGDDGSYTQDFWEYDPSNNTWTQKANFGGTARYGAVGFTVGTKGYLGTGFDGASKINDFWEYDPTIDDTPILSTNNASCYNASNGTASATVVGNTPPYSYLWSNGQTTSTITGLSMGNYSVTVTNGNGCNFSSSATIFSQNNPWTEKTNFGGSARYAAVGFSIGSKGYIGTGGDGGSAYYNDFWEYDNGTNTWAQKANFGGSARLGAVGFSLGTKGYIGTGLGTGSFCYKDFWEYDPSTNTWIQKANFGGTSREAAVGFSIGTKGYLGTGNNGANKYNDFWEYDPSNNTWAQKANFGGTARYGAVGFSIGTKGYLGTGAIGFCSSTQDFWEYNPVTNIWTQKANFGGAARSGAFGFNLGTNGYIGTGNTGGCSPWYNDFWEYNPSTNVWTQKSNFGVGYPFRGVGFSIGAKGYVGTGYIFAGVQKFFWEYDPAPEITANISTSNASCYGLANGTATVTLAGGTTPYTYLWSNGQTTSTATVLSAGNYNVTVINANGCTIFATTTINEPTVLNTATTTTATACNTNNGIAMVTASGGTSPYTYLWSNGQTTQTVAALGVGNYSVTVTDANGCSTTATVNISYKLGPAVSITGNQNVSCNGGSDGSLTANASGGTSPYTYLWSNSQTTQTLNGLAAAVYSVIVNDANGCSDSATLTITQPTTLFASTALVSGASCSNADGSASASATGGTAPYTYAWSNGTNSNVANGLIAGNYTVSVSDANNCITSTSLSVNNTISHAAPNICSITVDSLSLNNLIIWDKTQITLKDTILIYRDIANNNYQLIGRVPYDSLSMFVDNKRTLYAANGDPNVSSWRYKISVKDSCGNESAKSPYHQSLFIQNSNGNFSWNDYKIEGEAIPIPALQNYIFERDNISNGNWQNIQTLGASSLAYTDLQYSAYQSTANWRVQTLWSIACTPTLRQSNNSPQTIIVKSKSNILNNVVTFISAQHDLNLSTSIYPNPASNMINVRINTAFIDNATLELYDATGKLIMQQKVVNEYSTFNINALANGIYTVRVITDSEQTIKRIVKQQ